MRSSFLVLAVLLLTACSRHVLQRSISMESYRMDEETKSMFVETNPIGASFSITAGPIDHGVCTCFVKFSGFVGRKDYLLFCVNTGDSHNPIAMHSLTIDNSYVIEHANDPESKKSYFEIQLPAILGFQSTWYLWSEDNSIQLCHKAIPRPLQTVASDGATLTVIRKESGGNFVDIQASGLKAGEDVCFVFQSMGEEYYYPGKVLEDGKLHLPLLSSFVGLHRGTMSGKATVLLVRETENLEISYDWDLTTTEVAAKKS